MDQIRQIRGDGRRKVHRLRRFRVKESQFPGMQSLPGEMSQRRQQPLASTRRACCAPTIDGIAYQRMLTRREMHSNLVGATRFETDIKVGVRAKSLRNPVVSDSRLAIGYHCHLGAGGRVTPYGLIDRAASRERATTDRAI